MPRQSQLVKTFLTLTDYQKRAIIKTILDYDQLNQQAVQTCPTVCPVCQASEGFYKRGWVGKKQRYQCKSCQHRFVFDKGQLTAHSHQPLDAWGTLMLDTLCAVPMTVTAATIDVNPTTVFYMRHKFLRALEILVQSEQLADIIELDETYVNDSYKGTPVPTGRKARKHGESAQQRGLSEEKVCVCFGADRVGHMVAQCVNRAKPTSHHILSVFQFKVSAQSIIITDGAFCYDAIKQVTRASDISLKSHTSFTPVLHLNTVNNLHSHFKQLMIKYRGVSTKYLNRYLALFVFMRQTAQMDAHEKLLLILRKLKQVSVYATISQIKSSHLLAI